MKTVITGASSGIGRDTAVILAADPENEVFAVARNADALIGLSEGAGNRNIVPIVLDITSGPDSLRELKNRLKAEAGKIDIMINNAGFLLNKPFGEFTSEEIRRITEVNLFAPACLIAELIPLMGRGSHVVNIASMGGFQGSVKFPGLSWYSASKGALAVLTECLAAEYSEAGISFNCLCPGAVQTEMFSKAFPGFSAPVQSSEMAAFVADFALRGNRLFNGKIIPVALSVP